MDFSSILEATIALFIIVDPVGGIPLMMGIVEGLDREKRSRVFGTATLVTFILLLAFSVIGQHLLALFSISINSFKIAGGLLLLALAMRILIYNKATEASPEDMGAVPIAFPLLAGPGAITATIVTLQTSGYEAAVGSVLIVSLLTWITLLFIDPIYRLLGKTGSVVINKVMAVFIASIAVKFITSGFGLAI